MISVYVSNNDGPCLPETLIDLLLVAIVVDQLPIAALSTIHEDAVSFVAIIDGRGPSQVRGVGRQSPQERDARL